MTNLKTVLDRISWFFGVSTLAGLLSSSAYMLLS
jgi:hypothetical protein